MPMCNQCKNNFLMEVIEAASKDEAVSKFRKSYNRYRLPTNIEFVNEGELLGRTYGEYLEQIDTELYMDLSDQRKPLNKLYIYSLEVFGKTSEFVVACVADKMRYACTSLSYIPGRRF